MNLAMVSRMWWVVPIAVLVALLARMLWEPRHPEITRVRMGQGERRLRVLLLTDLHAGLNQISFKRLEEVIRESEADVFLFGGDACSGRHDAAKARRLLARMGWAARQAGIPAYAVRGNHDRPLSDRDYPAAHFELLRNHETVVRAKDSSLWRIVGLDDLRHGEPRFPLPPTESAIPATRSVVLAHNPDSIYLIPARAAHFFLAGHFHGGQIWMPFHLEFRVLRHERLVKEKTYRGLFTRDQIAGYISRGLGCVVLPFRLGSRPEITFVDLYAPGIGGV